MRRQRIIKSQTKEPITIPQPEKTPDFEPIIDPNSPKICPDENPVGNPLKESTETPPYRLPKPSEFSINQYHCDLRKKHKASKQKEGEVMHEIKVDELHFENIN